MTCVCLIGLITISVVVCTCTGLDFYNTTLMLLVTRSKNSLIIPRPIFVTKNGDNKIQKHVLECGTQYGRCLKKKRMCSMDSSIVSIHTVSIFPGVIQALLTEIATLLTGFIEVVLRVTMDFDKIEFQLSQNTFVDKPSL